MPKEVGYDPFVREGINQRDIQAAIVQSGGQRDPDQEFLEGLKEFIRAKREKEGQLFDEAQQPYQPTGTDKASATAALALGLGAAFSGGGRGRTSRMLGGAAQGFAQIPGQNRARFEQERDRKFALGKDRLASDDRLSGMLMEALYNQAKNRQTRGDQAASDAESRRRFGVTSGVQQGQLDLASDRFGETGRHNLVMEGIAGQREARLGAAGADPQFTPGQLMNEEQQRLGAREPSILGRANQRYQAGTPFEGIPSIESRSDLNRVGQYFANPPTDTTRVGTTFGFGGRDSTSLAYPPDSSYLRDARELQAVSDSAAAIRPGGPAGFHFNMPQGQGALPAPQPQGALPAPAQTSLAPHPQRDVVINGLMQRDGITQAQAVQYLQQKYPQYSW